MIHDLMTKPTPFDADSFSFEDDGDDDGLICFSCTADEIEEADHEMIDFTIEEARKVVQSKINNHVVVFQSLTIDEADRAVHIVFKKT